MLCFGENRGEACHASHPAEDNRIFNGVKERSEVFLAIRT